MPPELCKHAHIPKETVSSSFLVACGVSVIVFSDIDRLIWTMCVILEESLMEKPEVISVTRGMCGVISRTDFRVTGGGWESANKNLLFSIQGAIQFQMHTRVHTRACRDMSSQNYKVKSSHRGLYSMYNIKIQLSLDTFQLK